MDKSVGSNEMGSQGNRGSPSPTYDDLKDTL